jgi:hypothetical protein
MPALMRALDGEEVVPLAAPAASVPRQTALGSEEQQAADMAAESSSPDGRTQSGALYTLEAPVICPECRQEIRTLRVFRVLRTQVSFTSTLPRRGYVIVCPDCDRILSAELSGLV